MMLTNIFYLILALFGLGFLVFIHELGHYFVAKWKGIKIEVFSIGFGPAFREWKIGEEKWKLCILPFGGYVLMAGMEQKNGVDPAKVPDGFLSKTPFDRLLVALAGPVANIIFAFIAFTLIWTFGGYTKPFQQLTHIVGYVDAESALKTSEINPGDFISTYNGKTFAGIPDLMNKVALTDGEGRLAGDHINYWTGEKTPFSATLPKTNSIVERVSQVGIAPAQYLIFNDYTSSASPLTSSGIAKGDRVMWVDGSLIFSQMQLSSVLNESIVLLTLQRQDQFYQIKVPRIKIGDLRLSQNFKSELDDWKHAGKLSSKLSDLYFIPYQLSPSGLIEDTLSYMNANAEEVSPPSELSEEIHAGDRIVAISGTPIKDSYDILSNLQERKALVIVQKNADGALLPWTDADTQFENTFNTQKIAEIAQSIGTPALNPDAGDFHLLNPVVLKPLSELDLDEKTRAYFTAQYEMAKKSIEKIEDSQQRELQLSLLEQSQKRLMLGAQLTDRTLSYNPLPTTQFGNVVESTWKTITGLFTGSMPAKYLSGPVGIVQTLQNSWESGFKEALYWLAFVSLNLAILNLLPLPVFDGGRIVFSLIEIVTGRPLKAKTMERWILPFVILIIIFFIYTTYQDIIRLLQKLF